MTCQTYCESAYFLRTLKEFKIEIGEHTIATESTKETFIASFAPKLSNEEVTSALDLNGAPLRVRNHYKAAIEFEFGAQKDMIVTEQYFPCVANLCLLSKQRNLDILIVCDSEPMRNLRRGQKVMSIRSNGIDAGRIVIGIVGLNIFHELVQPAEDSDVWSRLTEYATILDIYANMEETEDEEEDEEDEDEEEEVGMDSRPAEIAETPRAVPTNSISIKGFIQRFSGPINESIYTDETKIDMDMSYREEFSRNPIGRWEQTYDLDGLFGVFDWKDMDQVLKGNVSVLSVPHFASKRDLKSFKKTMVDSIPGMDFEDRSVICFKVGVCSTNFGIVDIFCGAVTTAAAVEQERISDIFRRTFTNSRRKRCFIVQTGTLIHEGCMGEKPREISDSQKSTQANASKKETVDDVRFSCIAFHFEPAIRLALASIGLEVSHLKCYVQAVGMKFTLSSSTVNGVSCVVDKIRQIFVVDRMDIYYDVCISTLAHRRELESEQKVFLFWKKHQQESLDFLGRGQYYPFMFIPAISNFHGNKTHGNVYKRNFYNSVSDLLESNSPNKPARFLKLANKLLAATDAITHVEILVKIQECIQALKTEVDRLRSMLESATDCSGSVRMEIRIKGSQIDSIFPAFAARFSPRSMASYLHVVDAQNLMALAHLYVVMLSEPILMQMRILSNAVHNFKMVDVEAMVATVSIFENLLAFTMFSGNTNTYFREMVWAVGETASVNSFRLMESMNSHNRLIFPSRCWDLAHLRIKNGERDIEKLFERMGGNSFKFRESLKFTLFINNPTIPNSEKAEYLWESYFKEIPREDYVDRPEVVPWKREFLKTDVSFTPSSVTIKEAVNNLFDNEKMKKRGWDRQYLRGYCRWIDVCKSIRANPCAELISAAERMRIEVIRYHSTSDTENFFARGRTFQRIKTNDLVELGGSAFFRGESVIDGESIANARLVTKRKLFSVDESIDLIRGVNSFGEGKWKIIKTCSSLVFKTNNRTNVDLKDRFRNLKSSLLKDGEFVYLEGAKDRCLNLVSSDSRIAAASNPANRIQFQPSAVYIVPVVPDETDTTTGNFNFSDDSVHIEGHEPDSPSANSSTRPDPNSAPEQEPVQDNSQETVSILTVNSVEAVKTVLNRYYDTADSATILEKLLSVPTEFGELRISDLKRTIPRRLYNLWDQCFHSLISENMLQSNSFRKLRRTF